MGLRLGETSPSGAFRISRPLGAPAGRTITTPPFESRSQRSPGPVFSGSPLTCSIQIFLFYVVIVLLNLLFLILSSTVALGNVNIKSALRILAQSVFTKLTDTFTASLVDLVRSLLSYR